MNRKIVSAIFFASVLMIVAGTAIVLLIPQILDWLPYFLEEKVFHRSFNHEAYRGTMVSLSSFPIFIAILVDALFFHKFSDRKKIVLLSVYLVSVLLTLIVTSYTCALSFTDQDLSSETLFAKECFESRTFWPTTWYYSMEFRFLNTQLISAPLFAFTDNLALVRTVTAFAMELILFGSTWFLTCSLGIRRAYMKFLASLLMISPVSWAYFTVVQGGSYYIPHIVFSFFYVGIFLRVVFEGDTRPKSRNKALFLVFIVLAFLSGVSTIRYILNFAFPVWAVAVSCKAYGQRKNFFPFDFRSFFIADKSVFVATAGLLSSGIGYVFNSVVIASVFTFKNMNKITFNSLGEMTIDGIKNMILDTAGYNENVSVFTPGGVSNILLAVILVLSVVLIRELFKKERVPARRFFIRYALFFFVFHFYTNVCTEMTGRYFTMVFVFFVPVLLLAVENDGITVAKKWALLVSASVLILTNSYLCFGRMQTGERSLKLEGVCAYLEKNGYEFGYAFSNIANPIWFWSNGKIEVASIDSRDVGGVNTLPAKFSVHKWLEPKKFTDKKYYKGGKHVFLVMKETEYRASVNTHPRISALNRIPVFKDGEYVIFEYETPEEFISSLVPSD